MAYDWTIWVPPGARQRIPGSTSQPPATTTSPAEQLSNKVFLVHGHDDTSKNELALFLYWNGLQPIILHEQAEQSQTLIKKFERYAADVKYAFVLLTPDDIGFKNGKRLKPRARQNVILELGYFWGKLGRDCCLAKEEVEVPSDMYGIVPIEYRKNIAEINNRITQELRAGNYRI
jgi:predicted nucleotide-binding protein